MESSVKTKSTDQPIGGFQSSFKEAEWIVFGSPLDQTASFRSGCKEGPDSIRKLALNLETLDPFSGKDIAEKQIHDMGNLVGDRKELLKMGRSIFEKATKEDKKVLMLGGEHTITLTASKSHNNSLFVVFDAHLDLREKYNGDPYSHASVMKRMLDHISPNQLIFIGTRAISLEEKQFIDSNPSISIFRGHTWTKDKEREVLDLINKKLEDYEGIYLSVDMDGFDPSFVPGVGNPEPLGLTTREFFELVNKLPYISGADITELNPSVDKTGTSSAVAARLAMHILTHS